MNPILLRTHFSDGSINHQVFLVGQKIEEREINAGEIIKLNSGMDEYLLKKSKDISKNTSLGHGFSGTFGSFGFVSVRAVWMNQKSVRFRFVFPRFVSWRANWLMPTVSICHIDCYGHGFNPEKVRFRDESHQWGVELRLSSTPKSCAQRWKVSVRGWTRMWVPVQPRKVRFRDERHQWGFRDESHF